MSDIKIKKRSDDEKEAYYVLKIATQGARIAELEGALEKAAEDLLEGLEKLKGE